MTKRLAHALVATALAVIATGCASGGPGSTPGTFPPTGTPPPTPVATVDAHGCPTTGPDPMPAGETRTVTITTSKGTITIKVEGALGPLAAANFAALAGCGFYDGVVFHRLVPGFVIQGGDPTGTGRGGPGYEFPNDPVSVPYARGVVAMANAGRDTNGSQFFIVLADSGLGPDYSVFGRVTEGMETVDAIAAMPNSGGQTNAAIDPVAMESVTVTNP